MEEGTHALGAEPLLNLRRGRVPHPLSINDRFFSGFFTIFPLASFYKWKNLKAMQVCTLTFQRVIANIERNNLFNGYYYLLKIIQKF